MQSIFISIPSYRDAETSKTIIDLFEKSSGKFTLKVGVFWQLADEDAHLIPDSLYKYRIHNLYCKNTDSMGCCWARSEIYTKLYTGEDYFLGIDSHMRFEQDWDVTLVLLLTSLGEKSIISTYPNAYDLPGNDENLHRNGPLKIVAHGKNYENMPLLSPRSCSAEVCENYYIAAGLLFSYGNLMTEVPYDPNLYFFGEEISFSVRCWTRNWTIYNPGVVVAFHYYVRTSGEPKHWTDNIKPEQVVFRNNSVKRVKHLMGLETSTDPKVLFELDKYGLGTDRTMAEYYATTGILNLEVMT